MRVVAAVTDLFFKARVASTGLASKAEVLFETSLAGFVARANEGPVDLIVVDLNAREFEAVGLVRSLKSEPMLADVPIVGFLSHMQVDLKREAEAAGIDAAIARSEFVARLPGLLAGTEAV